MIISLESNTDHLKVFSHLIFFLLFLVNTTMKGRRGVGGIFEVFIFSGNFELEFLKFFTFSGNFELICVNVSFFSQS